MQEALIRAESYKKPMAVCQLESGEWILTDYKKGVEKKYKKCIKIENNTKEFFIQLAKDALFIILCVASGVIIPLLAMSQTYCDNIMRFCA